MKNLIFIALMLSFLVGNAQQDRNQFAPAGTREPAQLYKGINPGYSSEVALYRNNIMKPDYNINPGYPSEVVLYSNQVMKPDYIINPGFPSEIYLYRNKSVRKY